MKLGLVLVLAYVANGANSAVLKSQEEKIVDNDKANGTTESSVNYSGVESEAVQEDVPFTASDVPAITLHNVDDGKKPAPIFTAKQKRCPSGGVVGASLKQNYPIKTITRRDIQEELNKKLCETCLAGIPCKNLGQCDRCKRWCNPEENISHTQEKRTSGLEPSDELSETPNLASRFGPTEEEEDVVGAPNPEQSSSLFRIAYLEPGLTLDVIARLLNILDTSDIAEMHILIKTKSGTAPVISKNIGIEDTPKAFTFKNEELVPQVTKADEKLGNQLREGLSKALEAKRNDGEGQLNNQDVDTVIKDVLAKASNTEQVGSPKDDVPTIGSRNMENVEEGPEEKKETITGTEEPITGEEARCLSDEEESAPLYPSNYGHHDSYKPKPKPYNSYNYGSKPKPQHSSYGEDGYESKQKPHNSYSYGSEPKPQHTSYEEGDYESKLKPEHETYDENPPVVYDSPNLELTGSSANSDLPEANENVEAVNDDSTNSMSTSGISSTAAEPENVAAAAENSDQTSMENDKARTKKKFKHKKMQPAYHRPGHYRTADDENNENVGAEENVDVENKETVGNEETTNTEDNSMENPLSRTIKKLKAKKMQPQYYRENSEPEAEEENDKARTIKKIKKLKKLKEYPMHYYPAHDPYYRTADHKQDEAVGTPNEENEENDAQDHDMVKMESEDEPNDKSRSIKLIKKLKKKKEYPMHFYPAHDPYYRTADDKQDEAVGTTNEENEAQDQDVVKMESEDEPNDKARSIKLIKKLKKKKEYPMRFYPYQGQQPYYRTAEEAQPNANEGTVNAQEQDMTPSAKSAEYQGSYPEDPELPIYEVKKPEPETLTIEGPSPPQPASDSQYLAPQEYPPPQYSPQYPVEYESPPQYVQPQEPSVAYQPPELSYRSGNEEADVDVGMENKVADNMEGPTLEARHSSLADNILNIVESNVNKENDNDDDLTTAGKTLQGVDGILNVFGRNNEADDQKGLNEAKSALGGVESILHRVQGTNQENEVGNAAPVARENAGSSALSNVRSNLEEADKTIKNLDVGRVVSDIKKIPDAFADRARNAMKFLSDQQRAAGQSGNMRSAINDGTTQIGSRNTDNMVGNSNSDIGISHVSRSFPKTDDQTSNSEVTGMSNNDVASMEEAVGNPTESTLASQNFPRTKIDKINEEELPDHQGSSSLDQHSRASQDDEGQHFDLLEETSSDKTEHQMVGASEHQGDLTTSMEEMIGSPTERTNTAEHFPKLFPNTKVHKLIDGQEVPVHQGSSPFDHGLKASMNSNNQMIDEEQDPENQSIVGSGKHDKDSSEENRTNLDTLKDLTSGKDAKTTDIANRGHFVDNSNWYQNFGKIVSSDSNKVSFENNSSNVFFLGNGINLPLQMTKHDDGTVHLTVDLEKLCSCKNVTCPKNHAAIEKAAEIIREKEAEFENEALNLATDPTLGIQLKENEMDYDDVPLGMATPDMDKFDEEKAISHDTSLDETELKKEAKQLQNKITDEMVSEVENSQDRGLSKRSPKTSSDFTNEEESDEENVNERVSINKYTSNDKSMNTKPTRGSTKSIQTPTTNRYISSEEDEYYNKDRVNKYGSNNDRKVSQKTVVTPPTRYTKTTQPKMSPTTESVIKNSHGASKPVKPVTLQSRFGDYDETYDEVAPIKDQYKFKRLEEDLEKKLNRLNMNVEKYHKKSENMLKKSAKDFLQTDEDAVVKKKVNLVSNVLEWMKDLAVDVDEEEHKLIPY